MPGFFESLKRMAQGKPVFDSNDSKQGWTDKDGNAHDSATQAPQGQGALQRPQEHGTGVVKGNASTFPVVVVKRTRTQLSGTNQAVHCAIVNRSNAPVELEEIHLAGSSKYLGGALRPGEEREYLCYSGSTLRSDSHEQATLNYKNEDGDYFQSVHDVECHYGSDKTYSIEDLHFRAPVRDIYG